MKISVLLITRIKASKRSDADAALRLSGRV